MIFEATGIDDMGRQFAVGAGLSIPDTIVRRAYVAHREAIEVTMVGTQLLGVRIGTLARFVPILLVLYAIGSIDGLVQRAIRTACGGRESASLYHRAKYTQLVVIGLGGVALLVWPGAVEWAKYSALIIVTNSGLVRLQWAYYKKHM